MSVSCNLTNMVRRYLIQINNYLIKESFANLQSFKSATSGKLGSNAETIAGTKMRVAYSIFAFSRCRDLTGINN